MRSFQGSHLLLKLRPSTISVAEGRIKTALEADWNDVPIEHITIDSVNETGLEEAAVGPFVGDDKGGVADHAAYLVGILERQETAVLPNRTGNSRARQAANEDTQPSKYIVLLGTSTASLEPRLHFGQLGHRPTRTVCDADFIGRGMGITVQRATGAEGG